MASLSLVGWINSLSASGLVIFGIIFGVYVMYKAKKTNAQLLYFLGLTILFAGLGWLGNLVDFMTILSTGSNMDNPRIYILLSMVWLPLTIICAMYVGIELIIPERKWYIMAIYIILGVIYEIFLFVFTFSAYTIVYPSPKGSNLIDESLIFISPVGIITIIFILSVAIFLGFGFMVKAVQSSGSIRTNFLIVSIGVFLFIVFGMLDTFGGLLPAIALVFIRIGILCSLTIMYFGFFRHLGSRE